MDKLQELTDKLYNEGLSKGKQEGEAILQKAREQAEEILAAARKEAQAIITQAHKDAEDYTTKVKGDLKMASVQALQATRKDLEDLVVTKQTSLEVSKALSQADFVKEILRAVAGKFSAEEGVDLEVVLPESLKAEMEPFVKNELSKALSGGITASFSKKISGGFTIAPKDGGYFISLTDETFEQLISEYLRPTTKALLFGNK